MAVWTPDIVGTAISTAGWMPRGEPPSFSIFLACYQSVTDQFRHRPLAFCPTCERQSARPLRVGGRLGAAEHFGAVTPLSLSAVKRRVCGLDEPRGVGGVLGICRQAEADGQPPSREDLFPTDL